MKRTRKPTPIPESAWSVGNGATLLTPGLTLPEEATALVAPGLSVRPRVHPERRGPPKDVMNASTNLERGDLVRYVGHHAHMRDACWVYLGDDVGEWSSMSLLIAPDRAPSPLPSIEAIRELACASSRFYARSTPTSAADHPARRAGQDWWFDVYSAYREELRPADERAATPAAPETP